MASNDPAPPSGFEARPATRDDLPAIDRLYLASEEVLGILPEPRASYLGWRWSQPYVDVERDTRVVYGDGALAAFSMTHHEGIGGPLVSTARTHPGHTGRGLGSWLVERAVVQARSRGLTGVRTAAPREDAAAQALLLAHGFTRVRSSFDMGTELTGAETRGEPPQGVSLRAFARGVDEHATWIVENTAFRDHWDHVGEMPFEIWEAEWFGGDATTRILLAESDGDVVGEVAWEAVEGGAYILSAAVLPSHRRRGIAAALLRAAIADVAAEGHRDVYLSVDAESPTGAVGVYERVGLSIRRVVDVFDRDLLP